MPIDLSKIRKKINPPLDGQDVAKLRTAIVTAIDSTTGAVTIEMNLAEVENVPVLGATAFEVGTVVQVLSYRGSLLILGPSGAVTSQPVTAVAGGVGDGTTGSTSFTNNLTGLAPGGGVFGVVFVAPPSGKVLVLGRVTAGHSVAGSYTHLDFEIRAGSTIGSGSVARSASDVEGSTIQSPTNGNRGQHFTTGLVTGLTPGTVYNAALAYKLTGTGTGTYNRRNIQVIPQ